MKRALLLFHFNLDICARLLNGLRAFSVVPSGEFLNAAAVVVKSPSLLTLPFSRRMLASMSHVPTRLGSGKPSSLIPPTVLPKYFTVPFAIQHGYFRCVRYLLELCSDPNERDQQLRTPLILCAHVDDDQWSLSLAQNLLEKGAKVALEDHTRRNAYVESFVGESPPLSFA